MKKKRRSAEVRAQEEQDELYLKTYGWWKGPDGWRHRRLGFVWPIADAKRATEDAQALDENQKHVHNDLVHRALRGET